MRWYETLGDNPKGAHIISEQDADDVLRRTLGHDAISGISHAPEEIAYVRACLIGDDVVNNKALKMLAFGNADQKLGKAYRHCASDDEVYEATGVPVNHYGIIDRDEFDGVQRVVCFFNLTTVLRSGITRYLDGDHLRHIHGLLFKGSFDWTGRYRNAGAYDIHGNPYPSPEDARYRMDHLFEMIAANRYLVGVSLDYLIRSLANIMGWILEIHPFMDGNSRIARAFVETLALNCGYDLDLSAVPKRTFDRACLYFKNGNRDWMRLCVAMNIKRICDPGPVFAHRYSCRTLAHRMVSMIYDYASEDRWRRDDNDMEVLTGYDSIRD